MSAAVPVSTGLQITCERRDLLAALRRVERIVPAKAMLPVLANVLVVAEGGELRLTATNLDLAVRTWLPASVAAAGAVTLPGRLLADLVGSLPDAEVSLTCQPGRAVAALTCARTSTKLRGIDADDFPALPAVDPENTVTLPGGLLRTCLRSAVIAVARADNRPAMTSVLFRLGDGQLTCVGCDGSRLARRAVALMDAPSAPVDLLVPLKACQELLHLLDDAEPVQLGVTLRTQHASFRTPDAELITRLIDAQFPRFEPLIPTSYRTRVVLNTEGLLQATRAVDVFAATDMHYLGIRLTPADDPTTPGTATIATSTQVELGEHVHPIAAAIEGEAAAFAVDGRYLREAVEAIGGDEVVLDINAPGTPVALRPVGDDSEHVQIIMPMVRKDESGPAGAGPSA